ncbi:MAG: hypothetical protein EXR69_04865 [Myxococcales bacterium]|nr:hypothetical protein [Myxococcales bacterium]
MTVRLFLQQPLSSMKGQHLPTSAMILEGELVEVNSLGVRLRVQTWMDDKGKELTAEGLDLLVPAAKVDHIAYR